ncbi:HD domain-containing protein [Desulfobotulus sp. H1]|uniref:HD domain-containing protein n=1 Tax=Desulfobotulus pelophilus TaxID=2823377 RepID=A0ABT3N827_9BACT|nr:HD domain-containing protein [Desulfobotulus pelophilus]MCW7753605.1 HD domain-containing protein [Desulfobotulus pelophilus]
MSSLSNEVQKNRPFCSHAAAGKEAVRRCSEAKLTTDYRFPFSVDSDRILHSMAYTRYIDKTQVFSLIRNDHLTHRVLHVQLVSKIGRTIGRFLGLNEDLIEAIALGHDIGHSPFGHDGERFLSDICLACGIGTFQHNAQSVQFLDKVERKGRGWNLSIQTLDGILCHDGEVHDIALKPEINKNFRTLETEIDTLIHHPETPLTPMTYEGCVMRMADTIAYIGRDIEDAIRIGIIRREDLPAASVAILGETNGTIVYRLVTDIIASSQAGEAIRFSPEISHALFTLRQFNMEAIYLNPAIKQHLHGIRDLFHLLFSRFMDDLALRRENSPVFTHFLHHMDKDYIRSHRDAAIVRDFISGMTDSYFLEQCPESLRPRTIRMG